MPKFGFALENVVLSPHYLTTHAGRPPLTLISSVMGLSLFSYGSAYSSFFFSSSGSYSSPTSGSIWVILLALRIFWVKWSQFSALAISFVDGIGTGPSSGIFSSISLSLSSTIL